MPPLPPGPPSVRKTPSAMRWAVVHRVLDEMVARVVARWKVRQGQTHYRHERYPDEELDTLARMARLEASEAVTDAYRRGTAEEGKRLREELGLPAVGDPLAESPTSPGIACPTCGRRGARYPAP